MDALSALFPDAVLVRRALADELDAFEVLVRRYQRRAHAVARALGVAPDSVDDVVQEAFLQAFSGLRALRAPEAFGAWLLNIVRNLARKRLKRHGLETAADSEALEAVEAPREGGLEFREIQDLLWREVARLPEGIREAIFLYYYEGERTRRVARSLGVSVSAVKSRLLRGRDLLRERLWEEFGESLRREVGPARGWRQRGRRLALLVAAGRPPEASADAPGPSGGPLFASPPSVPLAGIPLTGAVLMSATKVLGGLALAAILVVGGGLVYEVTKERGSPQWAVAPIKRPGAAATPPVGSPQTGAATVEMAAPARRSGISGTVYLGAPPALAVGAQVVALRENDLGEAGRAIVGADGCYEIVGLAPGAYLLWAWKDDWAQRYAAGVWDPVQVEERMLVEGVDRILEPGVILHGAVVEEGTDLPVAGANVSHARLNSTTTREDGSFRLEGVPQGLVWILAKASGFAGDSKELDVAHGETPSVTFTLARGGTIAGTVTLPGGGPAAGAQVEAIPEESRIRNGAIADAKGRYLLEGVPLRARQIVVTASLGGFFAAQARVEGFPPGETRLERDLQLEAGFRLGGRVVDGEGKPLQGVSIRFVGSLIFREDLRTDAEGRFEVAGASERVFCLTARRQGFAPATVELRDLDPGARESIEIVLERGAAVSGVVVDAAGTPIEGATVYVEPEVGLAGGPLITNTDAAGRFLVNDLPPGRAEIGVSKSGYANARGEPVTPGQNDIRLVLVEAGQILGQVVDKATGAPLDPLLVKVSFAEGRFHERNREKGFGGGLLASFGRKGLPFALGDGSFCIRHSLAAGLYYKLVVSAESYEEAILDGVEAWPHSEARPPLRVELAHGLELRGRVVDARSGKGLQGVRVRHLPRAALEVRVPWDALDLGDGVTVRTALSDGDGRFALAGLAQGPGVVLLEKAGYARTAFDAIVARGDEQILELQPQAALAGTVRDRAGNGLAGVTVDLSVGGRLFPRAAATGPDGAFRIGELPKGEAELTLRCHGWLKKCRDVVLRAGETSSVEVVGGAGAIAGLVTRSGEPLAGARVLVKRLAEPCEQDYIRSGADGRFRAGGLDPGNYELRCDPPERRSFLSGPGREVEVGEGETVVELEIAGSVQLSGRVLERATGSPIGGARVNLSREAEDLFARSGFRIPEGAWLPAGETSSDGGGSFGLPFSERGRYFVRVTSDAGQGWSGPLDLVPGAPTPSLVVEVGGGARLEATVRDRESREPVAGATVILKSTQRLPVYLAATSDVAGRVRLADFPPGPYRLEVHSPLFVLLRERVELGEEPLEKSIELEPAAWIVVELDGAPPRSGALALSAVALGGDDPAWPLVTVNGDQPTTQGSFALDAEGRWRARLKTRPGRYRVRLEVREVGPRERMLLHHQETDLEVAPEREALYHVVVEDREP